MDQVSTSRDEHRRAIDASGSTSSASLGVITVASI